MSNSNLIDNRQIRVFISSTFQDMQDERDFLMKRTFPMLRKLAAERDVTLTELDLRWGITEEEAKTGKVVEICLREIENSIPFFIGIIGNRYGWVPEKKDIGKNVTERFKDVNSYLERHLSVTEMEMQFGVLQRKEDMHAYFYIKEGEEKENADNPEMLESLKKEVKASRYPSTTYSSPENLGVQVEQAFRTLLDQIFPEGHLSELEKERIGQRSFMRQLCQNYIRDDKNFQALDEWMNDWEQHQLVVTGASGLGKSALVANWLKEKLSDDNRGYNIIYHFTGNGGSESSHEHIIKTLIDEINDVYGWDAGDEKNKQLKDKQDDKLNDLFIKVASEGKKPLLIVLDAINQIVDTENAKLLNWLPIPPKNIKILFSTLEDDRTMEVFNNRHYQVFVLQPISLEQRQQLVTEYLGKFGKKLIDKQIERITTDKQSENTLVLKTLLDELINFGVYEKLDERIDYYLLPDSIEDFYQALLKSYEEDYNGYCENFIKHALSLIVLSRNGLSEEEILKATGIKPLYWSQFYCAFSTHLVSKEGLISFAHRYVQNAVSARYTDNEDWVRTCRNEILSVVDNANTVRYLEEQTYQLDQLSEYEKLHDLLLNLKTFSTYYKVHPYELGEYWRKLITLGYSISEYFEITDSLSSDKTTNLFELGIFSREILADYDKAVSVQTLLLSIYKNEYGKNNKNTASSYNEIGVIFNDMGDYGQALRYHKEALSIRIRISESENIDISESYHNIGVVYESLGSISNALKYYHKSLNIDIKLLGEINSSVAITYDNIGIAYTRINDYVNALEYHTRALTIREKILGKYHPDTATSYNNIGAVCHNKGDYSKALAFFQRALIIREKSLGYDHPYTATSYNNVGAVYHNEGDYSTALDYYNKALSIRLKVFGENHSDTAWSYINIGNIYVCISDYSKALEYYQKAAFIREKIFGCEHSETVNAYNYIAWTLHLLGKYVEALPWATKARDTLPDDSEIVDTLATVYQGLDRYKEAMEQFELCLKLKKEQGASEADIHETEEKIEELKKQMK